MKEKVSCRYMALDMSTQSLTGALADINLKIVWQDSINYDSELPEFSTKDGVHRHADGKTITSPVLMWLKALDILLMKLSKSEVDVSQITVISGAAQQHGSVYWRQSAELTLSHLNPAETLVDQLQECFSSLDASVWMDSSSSDQCSQLEEVVGGALNLAQITGSRGFERFTGSQIAKTYQKNRNVYTNSERICLISNFLATVFLGTYAPIDNSDGSGMNLLNINTKKWDTTLLKACGAELSGLLGETVKTSTTIGCISQYMIKRYGFSPTCRLTAFTGDNPASFIGLNLTEGDMAVSLGTSDTLLFWTNEAKPAEEGHVFVNPIKDEYFMTMLCFKNGALPRQSMCEKHCNGSWETYSRILQNTHPGNSGNLGVYLHDFEILPHAQGVYKVNEKGEVFNDFTAEEELRAVVEGQFLARKFYAQKFGLNIGSTSKIIATGGTSKNTAILQVLADVFNAPVYTVSMMSNSVCLGALYQCQKADGVPVIYSKETLACEPSNTDVYKKMLECYKSLEERILNEFTK